MKNSSGISRIALIGYVPMICCIFFTKYPGTWKIEEWDNFFQGLIVAGGIGIAVVWMSKFLIGNNNLFREMTREFKDTLGDLSSTEILKISLLSGFGEEILFRGVIQPRLGLFWASLIFGLIHFPINRKLIPWTITAVMMGFILGILVEIYGCIWPSVFLHFLINYLNIRYITRGET